MFEKIYDWNFLNEPLWRWAIFYVAIILIATTWRFILEYMK